MVSPPLLEAQWTQRALNEPRRSARSAMEIKVAGQVLRSSQVSGAASAPSSHQPRAVLASSAFSLRTADASPCQARFLFVRGSHHENGCRIAEGGSGRAEFRAEHRR